MNMGIRLSVRLSPLMEKRLRLRAEEQGVTPSEYLRATIENDLKKGGRADLLAPVIAEVSLVTGMMLREWLTYALGKDRAKSLEDWANGRASGIIQEELRERSVDP
jgi:hypothetical protein